MRSDDWQPMETAPLNPYGEAFGPSILVWNSATGSPMAVHFEPWYGWKHQDSGPAWVLDDAVDPEDAIDPDDAVAWMPIAAPSCVLKREPQP